MGEVSYSLSSGQSDPRVDIFQSPFPAQQDKRDGRESASSILTFLTRMPIDVQTLKPPPQPPSAPSQREAINKVIMQESPT